MHGRLFTAVALVGLAGCFSPPPQPVNWTIECPPTADLGCPADRKPLAATARLTSVSVRAPYNGTRIVVLRADGSQSSDAYNVFAASPATVLKGVSEDVLETCRVFKEVLPSDSTAQADANLEITVRRLALDCRKEGVREALVDVVVSVVSNRRVLCKTTAVASVSAADGRYTEAFSLAYGRALSEAAGKLKAK